ncbi:MAG TPA: phosphoglucosamine mutase [Pyrinomonadaceae bacterium]|nr:phosphoglucosamine mutase [Pyrinomonadaceae bacterium]
MQKLFGTDGMRGEAGRFPLDASTIETVGRSLAVHLSEKLSRTPVIVIGRDTRESGPWLERSLLDGVCAVGAEYHSAGVITTPGVAYLTRALPADAGIVISASHNPYQDNGIKIFSPSGQKLDDETERLIESDIREQSATQKKPSPLSQSEPNEARALQGRYLDFLTTEIGQGLSLSHLSLVVDCANGAASKLAPRLLERLGANVTAINKEPNGRNINQNCGALHIETLQQRVVTAGADLGIAYDGDADRALFVDNDGGLVDGDSALWIFAKYLQKRRELAGEMVVATVMSNVGLEIALHSRGLRLIRTAVGDKYVLDELLRLGASLGGEQSGHIIFPRLSLAGDGLITTLFLLRAMTEAGTTLQKLSEGFTRYPQVLVNVRVKEKRPFSDIEAIQKLADETESKLSGQGRLLLRYSGTEPLARVMIEGPNQTEIEQYANDLAHVIRDTLGAL